MRSGLIVEKSNTPGMGSLYIVYNGSAMKETSGYRGLSHLWEHLKCHSYDNLNQKLLASGITTNAYTSDNNVVFYWKGLDDQIDLYQNELLNLISYIPTEKQFLNEKKIVLQEYDDAASRQNFIFSNITRKYFDYYGPIGCRKDVEDITYDGFLKFASSSFVNPVQIIRIGESKTIDVDAKNVSYFDNSLTTGLTRIDIPTDINIDNPSTFGSTLIGDWIRIPKSSISFNMLTLILDSLSSGLSSPLYEEIRENNGLVYHCGMYLDSSDLDYNVVYFMAGCTHDNIQKVRDIVTTIMSNVHTYVTKERFDSVVEMSKNSLRISEIENYKNVNKYFNDDVSSFTVSFLKSVEYKDFEESIELFSSLYLKDVTHGHIDSEIKI